MVSTQHRYYPAATTNPIILGSPSVGKSTILNAIVSSGANSTSPVFKPDKVIRVPDTSIADLVAADAEAVLSGLSLDDKQPKTVADLLAMGAKRNDAAKTDHGFNETAAFHNDVAYYKALLEARRRHRTALQGKIRKLRCLRAKQKKVFRKRNATRRQPAEPPVPPAVIHVGDISANSSGKGSVDEEWQVKMPGDIICASPVSTDLESEGSDRGDTDVLGEKANTYRA